MILTKSQYDRLIQLPRGGELEIPVDFGLRTVLVKRDKDNLLFSHDAKIPLTIKLKSKFCYLVKRNTLVPCAFYSDKTHRFYKLISTKDWPSIAIGSVPMHSITRSSPGEDTERKLTLLKPYGKVLDTCMGLGYTAIGAAHQGCKVITFEKDSNVMLLAKINPFSRELFENSRITIRRSDINKAIRKFSNDEFDCIIHDPPTFTIAPELFGGEFYRQLYRTLKRGGKLYHYLPLYRIRQGYDFPAKIKRNLKETGFSVVKFIPQQGNLLCRK